MATGNERPRILDLPGGPVIADAWVRTGYGDAIPLVDAYLGIDTEALKLTALNLYGIPAQHDNTGRTSNVDDIDANLEVEGGGQLFVKLGELSRSVLADFGDVVTEWSGPAHDKAKERRNLLIEVISGEAHNARRIGQALWHFAETTEAGQTDVKAAIMGGAELGLTAHDLVTAGEKLARSLTIFGLVLDIVDNAWTRREELQRELQEIANADDQLSRLLDTRDPTRDMPDVSKDTHDWEVE